MSKTLPWKQYRWCINQSTIRRFLHSQTLFSCGQKHTTDQKITTPASKLTPATIEATTQSGAPISNFTGSLTVGLGGPIVLEDIYFLERMQHTLRERIPERFVHAKGAGAFGTFKVTKDITGDCKANLFSFVNKKTDCLVRFSTVGGEAGSSDNEREARGFAVKFYTEQGNWDLLCLSTPIFFIRDPILFPHLTHAQKRNPSSNLKDPNAFWDFMTQREESVHMLMMVFSDRGIPDGYQHMDGFAGNTFSMINEKGEKIYVKFRLKTQQGIKNITDPKDPRLGDLDYATRKLYEDIESGTEPSWKLLYQVMTPSQAMSEQYKSIAFDVTQVWPETPFPWKEIGMLTLSKNPKNYFAEIEQAAFNPSRLVPGIETSPDQLLQGRLFAYNDSQLHRVGTNYNQLPVNRPMHGLYPPQNYQRSGPQTIIDPGADEVNYYPNTFNGPQPNPKLEQQPIKVAGGELKRYDTGHIVNNFEQARKFYYNVLGEKKRARLARNIAASLRGAEFRLQDAAIKMFGKVSPELSTAIRRDLIE